MFSILNYFDMVNILKNSGVNISNHIVGDHFVNSVHGCRSCSMNIPCVFFSHNLQSKVPLYLSNDDKRRMLVTHISICDRC